MTDYSLTITPVVYFKSDNDLNAENITTFRNCYRSLSKIDTFDDHIIDETSLLNAAKQLRIQADSLEHQDVLRECVKYDDMSNTLLCVRVLISDYVRQRPLEQYSISEPIVNDSTENEVPQILKEIKCIVIIKQQKKQINDFLNDYLLQVVQENNIHQSISPNRSSTSNNESFLLHSGSLLALLIYEQMRSLGTIRRQNIERLRLVEPIRITDEFSTWCYDHFHGLFQIELRPHLERSFPYSWIMANDVRIYCQFFSIGTRQSNEITLGSNFDVPRTGPLEQFVQDVCNQENKMNADDWINALKQEDITSFQDLSNLTKSDWDNIRRLSMNARKLLKAAVDRVRESIDDNRRRDMGEDSLNETNPHFKNIEISSKESCSELLANLHLIKLFIQHQLRFDRTLKQELLSKLEPVCIDMAFDEMRREGYADDGLFLTMSEFFLPLTISEQEITRTRSNVDNEIRQNRLKELSNKLSHLETSSGKAAMYQWDIDDKITDLNQTIEEAHNAYVHERSRVSTELTARQQAEVLQEIDQQWQYNQKQYEGQLKQYKDEMKEWTGYVSKYSKDIDELNTEINNIQTELSQPQRPIDQGLVKPARGFIMYGPPGTGKSEIMSKLSKKLGITMVGPPLAAGELNRPLVGESERVIIALASRCHRVPYAMCCLSIDEIDSLAPKRDEDSSEGKVDKISVLLSLIDGIKDVPNLMIFCATNRLHMMDEAFLRRMSGKFFVGRPSSQARTKILAQMPEWALEPNLIDRLTVATTNFSGAACKAFTRAITVRCISAQRTQPNFHVNYEEALKIADRTAQQYQIFLCNETLPCLMLRNHMCSSPIPSEHLTRNDYTGRIIVDLTNSNVRIETVRNGNRINVIEHKLNENETKIQNLLERLTAYGKNRNVQLIQLIDLNLLASQGAYDEKKVFETLKERYDECVAYDRSMIIYDLDALVGVNKSEADSSMGRSINSNIVNQGIYTYVRARFREAVVELSQENIKQRQTIEKWAIAVIREPFLLRQFSNDVQFAKTQQEIDEDKLERQKREDLLKCVKCRDLYIEIENRMGNCIHHDGFIYDNSAPDLAIYTQSQVADILNKLDCDLFHNSKEKEDIEREKMKYKWICCDALVTIGMGTGGCKKGKHLSEEPVDRGQQRRNEYRLHQTTIKRWEEECQRNPEYNDRWLHLLRSRT